MGKVTLEFLGSGTSTGVPVIGCDCAVCTSPDPRNQRLRSSVLIRGTGDDGTKTTVLIDTTPDFRQQMLRSRVQRIDALILSHYHADHVVGIDDIRRFNWIQKEVIDCWASEETLASLERSFGYVLVAKENLRIGLPCLYGRPYKYGEAFEVGCLRFLPLALDHHVLTSTGFRITCGNSKALSYVLDVKRIPPETYAALEGTDTLVLDMLREKPHPTHMNLEEAMEAVGRIKPRRTYFGHIAHEVEHRIVEEKLPPEVRIAYDGLVLEIE